MNINFRSQRLLTGYDFLQSSQNDPKPIKVQVHEFIQSVVFTPFPNDSELHVERLTLASNIYESIGFKRKAAFYRRLAALKSVTVRSDWQACYDALLDSLKGFSLTLDPVEYEKSLADKFSSVWPGLHVQLIEDLITCCKKIRSAQSGPLSIRHMSFMLHTLDFYLSAAKKRDFARELEEASTLYGEDSPVPLKSANGVTIPTVNLTKYPLCLKLEPLPLPMPLRPVRLLQIRRRSIINTISEDKTDTPFIFTPILSHSSLTSFEPRRNNSDSLITDITWVQDEPCSTVMILKNTLPFELSVTSIKLLTDGVPLEAKPLSLKMAADPNQKTTVQLVGIPRQSTRAADDAKPVPSRLEIFGYSTHLLGVKSNCRLDLIPKSKFPAQYIVEVAPPMPRLEFMFPDDLQDTIVEPIPADQVGKDLVVMEVKATIAVNETIDTTLTVLNSSNVDVDYLFVQEKQKRTTNVPNENKLVRWDDEPLERLSTSPLKAGEKLKIPLKISAIESLFKSSKSACTSITVEYSGGIALQEMYCRKSTISITITI